LPAFIIEIKAKYQLEVSENKVVIFSHSSTWTSLGPVDPRLQTAAAVNGYRLDNCSLMTKGEPAQLTI
jgi:hypothetical protein